MPAGRTSEFSQSVVVPDVTRPSVTDMAFLFAQPLPAAPPDSPVPARGHEETALHHLTQQLVKPLLRAQSRDLSGSLRHAANEAAALAWMTPYPLLVLPLLLEEKIGSARARHAQQTRVRARSPRLALLVR